MENDPNLTTEIEKIISYFDLFDYPLTLLEVSSYLPNKASLTIIIDILESLKPYIFEHNGFYGLKGREEIINIRTKRYNYSNRKIKTAQRFLVLFKYLPFIKVISLANSIGAHNLREGSDIDFFIICSPRRLWLTRFLLAGTAKILNRRPTTKNKRDKICLSFYITTENLNLDSLKLQGADPYFYYWLRTLILLYNKDKIYEKFLDENGVGNEKFSAGELVLNSAQSLKKNHTCFALDFIELIVKKFQYLIMSPELKKAMNNSIGVVINDKVLKLYLHDNRQVYAEKYGNKLREIFKENN